MIIRLMGYWLPSWQTEAEEIDSVIWDSTGTYGSKGENISEFLKPVASLVHHPNRIMWIDKGVVIIISFLR